MIVKNKIILIFVLATLNWSTAINALMPLISQSIFLYGLIPTIYSGDSMAPGFISSKVTGLGLELDLGGMG